MTSTIAGVFDRAFGKCMIRWAMAAAVSVVGFGAFGVSEARADTRCVAQAVTIFGRTLSRTRASETRHRARRACRIAVNECERLLDRKRRHTGRAFPLAQCRVQRRVEVAAWDRGQWDRGHDEYAPRRTRCVAQAFTRRGRELSHTRAAETRRRQRRACRAALRQCETRLDEKRYQTGRRFPHARCDVIRRVAVRR